jgi:hypothetical protein
MLKENHSDHLRVFVVWEPILPSDWSRPSRFVQRRILDSRAVQFWDKRHLVAKQLKAHLSESQAASCSHSKILWDVVAVFPKDVMWNSAPDFIGGPVVRATPEAEKHLLLLARTQQ